MQPRSSTVSFHAFTIRRQPRIGDVPNRIDSMRPLVALWFLKVLEEESGGRPEL
tara:strand:+ start:1671 stop:1832 length:162 start_codon:yes stop_codon:yes gene_type:complete